MRELNFIVKWKQMTEREDCHQDGHIIGYLKLLGGFCCCNENHDEKARLRGKGRFGLHLYIAGVFVCLLFFFPFFLHFIYLFFVHY